MMDWKTIKANISFVMNSVPDAGLSAYHGLCLEFDKVITMTLGGIILVFKMRKLKF